MPEAQSPVRIFLVEDEFLVAMALEDDLKSTGYQVVGPFHDLGGAVAASREAEFEVALLDVNLSGTPVYPLAEEFLARGVPFVLLTGYAENNLPAKLRGQRRVSKPYELSELLDAIRQAAAPSISV